MIIFSFLFYFLLTYHVIGLIVAKRGVFYPAALPYEELIPFIPLTYFTYFLCFLTPPAAFFLIQEKKNLLGIMWVFFVSLTILNFIWLIYPVQYNFRPDITNLDVWYKPWIVWLYHRDTPPINCFPSLHITWAFMTYFFLKHTRIKQAPLFLITAILISLSTITFKQHYIADVFAGFLVALVVNRVWLKKG